MRKLLFAAILIASIPSSTAIAIDYDAAREAAWDEEYSDKETEIYVEGYEDGYDFGYETAKEKYDRTFWYELIPGAFIGATIYEFYLYSSGRLK